MTARRPMPRVCRGLLVVWTLLAAAPAAAQVLSAEARTAAAGLVERALAGSGAYAIVESLTVEVGPRPAGSAGDRAAVAWGRRAMARLGLSEVRAEAVTVPHGELPDATSANVVGEVRGREVPQEIVLLGCHLDSWDLGTGAQDATNYFDVHHTANDTLDKIGAADLDQPAAAFTAFAYLAAESAANFGRLGRAEQ